jgi:two-component sensor histidine kinase/PAS domain-containing protein
MASICLTIAINEFLVWSRGSRKRSDLAFVLICLGGTSFCLCCAGEYSIDLPAQSVFWLKGEVISISFTVFALFWFIAEETKLIDRRLLFAFLAWNAAVCLSQILPLGDLTWVASRPVQLRIELPFGLDFVYKEVERGTALIAADFVGFFALVYLATVVARFRRAGHRRESSVLALLLAVPMAAEVNDFFVGIGLYAFLYLMEYAWLMTILVLGLRRSREVMEAALTKLALQESDEERKELQASLSAIFDSTSDMIWSVEPEGFGLLTFNSSFRDYFELNQGLAVRVGMGPGELFPSLAHAELWREHYRRVLADGAFSAELNTFAGAKVLQLSLSPLWRDAAVFGISVFGKDITERRRAEDQIARSLAEKETLIRELYHRTKNNMNVIISMLKLQSREIGDQRLKEAFAETENRILSMALLHEKLYEGQDLSRVNLGGYLEDLVKHVTSSYALPGARPTLSLDLGEVYATIDTAVSCGLIVNELVSNALKYAFPEGGGGVIALGLRQDEGGEICLTVSDDGLGAPSGFDSKRDGHLGLRLIESLAKGKLRAEIEFATEQGFSCRLRFRESETY